MEGTAISVGVQRAKTKEKTNATVRRYLHSQEKPARHDLAVAEHDHERCKEEDERDDPQIGAETISVPIWAVTATNKAEGTNDSSVHRARALISGAGVMDANALLPSISVPPHTSAAHPHNHDRHACEAIGPQMGLLMQRQLRLEQERIGEQRASEPIFDAR